MSLAEYVIDYDGDGPTPAQPTTSETISNVNNHTALEVTVGGTATTVTVVRPGNDAVGTAVPDKAYGPLTNVRRQFKVDRNYIDSDGLVTVQFSQVTGVTAVVLRMD